MKTRPFALLLTVFCLPVIETYAGPAGSREFFVGRQGTNGRPIGPDPAVVLAESRAIDPSLQKDITSHRIRP